MGILELADKASKIGNLLKWLFIVVVVLVLIYMVLRAKRFKPEVENMIKDEFRLAKHIFTIRDALSRDSNDYDDNKKEQTTKKDRKDKDKDEKEDRKDKDKDEKEEVEQSERRYHKLRKGRDEVRRTGSKTSTWKREELCRKILEDYFDDYFPSVRPKFLSNPETGRPLELDGYNARLNLAFEHGGKQHYVYPNYYHKTKEEFEKQVKRDKWKYQRCKELGIHVLVISYEVPEKDLESYILAELKKLKM